MKKLTFLLSFLILASCSGKPVRAPNQKMNPEQTISSEVKAVQDAARIGAVSYKPE